jgi:pentose-5-phosphate-3-epimerase
MLHSTIVPAIIPKSFSDLREQVLMLAGLPEIHVDVLDGIFVPTTSWPYNSNDDVSEAQTLLAPFSLEVDLMVKQPFPAALSWISIGVERVVFHVETINLSELKDFHSHYDVTIGLSIGQTTKIEDLYPYIPYVDYVQVMGIADIGAQGQLFNDSVFARIEILKLKFPHLPLSIDGSVNKTTLPLLKKYTLERHIVGSAIMASSSPRNEYLNLTNLVI